MPFILKATHRVDLTLAVKDKFGNPAKVDGVPVWVSSNPEVLEVAVAADGLSAVVTPVGPAGSGQINVTADADLGAGSKEGTALASIDVVAGDAVFFELQPGEPTEV